MLRPKEETFRSPAEAVIDEVSYLENALREVRDAAERRRGRAAPQLMSPGSFGKDFAAFGGNFETAVASYGVQLRAWVDLQVDARLAQVLPGLLEGAGSEAVEAADRCEGEVKAIADAQAKLLMLVEGVSDEISRLKALAISHSEARSASQARDREAQEAREARDQSSSAERVWDSIEELRRSAADRERQDAEAHRRLQEKVSALEGRIGSLKGDLVGEFGSEQHRLAALEREVMAKESMRGDIESRLESRLDQAARTSESQVESKLLRHKSAYEEFLRSSLETLKRDMQQETKSRIESSQARLGEELVSLQQRLIAELRAETTAALNRESSAIAGLDQQLWITDQRLGQEIAELRHSVVRDRAVWTAGIKIGRLSDQALGEDGFLTHERRRRHEERDEAPTPEPTRQEPLSSQALRSRLAAQSEKFDRGQGSEGRRYSSRADSQPERPASANAGLGRRNFSLSGLISEGRGRS